jgi:hypothetical protein
MTFSCHRFWTCTIFGISSISFSRERKKEKSIIKSLFYWIPILQVDLIQDWRWGYLIMETEPVSGIL